MIVASATKKKLIPTSKRTKTAALVPPSKQPHQETEMAGEASWPTKRIKKLAKKRERENHIFSSRTTEVTTPSVSLPTLVVKALTEKRPTLTGQAFQVRPVPEVVVEPVAAPLVEKPAAPGPTIAPVLDEVTPFIGENLARNPKQKTIILEEDDESDNILLARHH